MDLSDPEQVKEYYRRSKQLRNAISADEEMKQKIIEYAKNLEMDKNKDYEKERKRFKLTHKFNE